jgi:hypothetical protein
MTAEEFITRWANSAASERANYQLFVTDLCALLEVPAPNPSSALNTENTYVFERSVTAQHVDGSSTTNFIDCYKRGAFVLEAKQGSEAVKSDDTALFAVPKTKVGTARRGTRSWDKAMVKAKAQAEGYARALPAAEGRPPFLIVVDVGYSLELFAEFTQSGGVYTPFPTPTTYRLALEDLRLPEVRDRLRAVWLEPLTLDPARRSAKATRDIAIRLAVLSRSLEGQHAPKVVSEFLMRLIFTMFAEDMGLLPKGKFTTFLKTIQGNAEHFQSFIEPLWQKMNTGGFSPQFATNLLHFNGGLFADSSALNLTEEQLRFVIEASEQEWGEVEPAIFGTLLERALDPKERHKLGAHYTPRAYVERLVNQTVLEPLRERWAAVQVEFAADLERVETLRNDPREKKDAAGFSPRMENARKDAIAKIETFHKALCNVRVLDPACGSGNFLYVALEMMKRLEGEVLDALELVGGNRRLEMESNTVDPHQFLGVELNPRAAQIAELVLWIGYLQWHFRTHGNVSPPSPVLRAFENIENRDAVLAYDAVRPRLDANGAPVTRWDGVTTKTSPVTGLEVPDETARVAELEYINPRRAVWPEADFVIGNPPFIGAGPMRATLGDGYATTLRQTHADVSESSDFVMYWWNHAATLLRDGRLERFGFVTTNSLRQTFNRRVLEMYLGAKQPISVIYAIPDHPWVDSADGAAVRIAITVAARGVLEGELNRVTGEHETADGEFEVTLEAYIGAINPDLTIGANVSKTRKLEANAGVSCPGVKLHGAGFIVTASKAQELGLGTVPQLERHIRPYRNGRDLVQSPRNVMVIDLLGLTDDQVRIKFPAVYQHVFEHVKPERDTNNRPQRRENWWLFGEPISTFRPALAGLAKYIATGETAKHRIFQFLDGQILPDNMITAIALDDGYHLGVLSSRIHVVWALAAGGRLGVGNDSRYNKSRCFEPFPFPQTHEVMRSHIRDLAEEIDAHRKRQLELHPELTLTEMYNTLEALRSGKVLTEKEKGINALGLVNTLLELHQKLDALVFQAYDWPPTLSDAEILERLVALNLERAALEAKGTVFYLRPEYQNPSATPRVTALDLAEDEDAPAPVSLEVIPFPKTLGEQSQAIRNTLKGSRPLTAPEVVKRFNGAKLGRVQELLDLLGGLGQISAVEGGRFSA